MTLYDLKKETELIKCRLQNLVSEDSYDRLINVCKGEKVNDGLVCALGELENVLVEINNIKYNKL